MRRSDLTQVEMEVGEKAYPELGGFAGQRKAHV